MKLEDPRFRSYCSPSSSSLAASSSRDFLKNFS
jgi:hypothetical protein